MTQMNNLNRLIFMIGKKYGTFNPFIWAENLNLEIYWENLYPRPLAKTLYYGKQTVIFMSNQIKDSRQRYFVLAHELGHVLEHEGLFRPITYQIMYISVKLNARQIILLQY